MNWVFWFLVIVALFFIWVGARRLFGLIGRTAYKKYDEVADVMTKEDEEGDSEE